MRAVSDECEDPEVQSVHVECVNQKADQKPGSATIGPIDVDDVTELATPKPRQKAKRRVAIGKK